MRTEYARLLAALVARTRDIEAAEEALQDAWAEALASWPRRGLPKSPAGWVLRVAERRWIDRVRREDRRRDLDDDHLGTLATTAASEEDDMVLWNDSSGIADERLRLIFTCCHPALAYEARVALTLNALCGLSTEEIARAFLVRTPTMAQRLVRAKRKIRDAGIPYRVPPADLLAERLQAVLAVVYLVFNEGYSASAGDAVVRTDLCEESLRLARLLTELLPDEVEAAGLLALLLLQNARRAARQDQDGNLILLADQDRSLWDREAIGEGLAILEDALRSRAPGPYLLQAAIAALHARAERAADTDWKQVVGLYELLLRDHPTPVVRLNHAVAVGEAFGPEAGLRHCEGLARALGDYVYFHAARASFLERMGERALAAEALRSGLSLAANEPERRLLQERLAALEKGR